MFSSTVLAEALFPCAAPAAELVKPNSEHAPLPADAGEESIASLDKIRNSKGNLHTAEIRRRMQRTMQVGRELLQPHLCLLVCFFMEEDPAS